MNRAVKAILALAIALVYTIMVFLLFWVVFPDPPYRNYDMNTSTAGNTYSCNTTQSNTVANPRNSPQTTKECQQQEKERIKQEDEKRKQYDENIKKDGEIRATASSNRLKLSLGFVILGFIVAFIAVSFTPLAVGMSAGATIIMILSTSIPGSTSIVDATITLLYLACFILLVVMLFVIDKILPAPLVIGPVEYATTPVPASKSEPVVDATTLAPNGTIPPK